MTCLPGQASVRVRARLQFRCISRLNFNVTRHPSALSSIGTEKEGRRLLVSVGIRPIPSSFVLQSHAIPSLQLHNTLIVLLIAWACIPFPSGLSTDEARSSTGLARTFTSVCNYLGVPAEHRAFWPVYQRPRTDATFEGVGQSQTSTIYMRWPFNILTPKTTAADPIVRKTTTMAKQRMPASIPVYKVLWMSTYPSTAPM